MFSFRPLTVIASSLLLAFAGPALADWNLDAQRSTVQFMSVKNASVAELHHFKTLGGGISDAGVARVEINLDSVETLVPIRNERMREMLFETVRFPAATLVADVPSGLDQLAAGESRDLELSVMVDLHGTRTPVKASARATRLADGGLRVSLAQPLIIRAADFGLEAGVEMLREVVGLQNISTAVPVLATLVFVPADQ